MEQRISVDGDKYTVVMNDNGALYALRHGEPWRDLVGDKLVFNLAYELWATREEVTAYRKTLEHIANGHPNAQQFARTLLAVGANPDLIKG